MPVVKRNAVVQQSETINRDSLPDYEFRQFQGLIYRHTGMFLSERKRALLIGRLSKRMRALDIASSSEYLRLINDQGQDQERIAFFNVISTNETSFFRNAAHFELLENKVLPDCLKSLPNSSYGRGLRIWSAACSTGEEPYSLAMTVSRYICDIRRNFSFQIMASDLSTTALDVATKAIYPKSKADTIPPGYRKKVCSSWDRGQGRQNQDIQIN